MISPITLPANAIQIKSKSDIKEGDRVVYELGSYTRFNYTLGRWDGWRRVGQFIEIRNVKEFLEVDTHLDDPEYIKHHNFHIIRD